MTSSSWRVCVTTSLLHATPPTAGATRGPRAIAELPGDPLAPCPPDCCLPLSSHVPPGSLRRVAAGHSPPPGLPPRPRTDSDKRPERFMATLRTGGRKEPAAPGPTGGHPFTLGPQPTHWTRRGRGAAAGCPHRGRPCWARRPRDLVLAWRGVLLPGTLCSPTTRPVPPKGLISATPTCPDPETAPPWAAERDPVGWCPAAEGRGHVVTQLHRARLHLDGVCPQQESFVKVRLSQVTELGP